MLNPAHLEAFDLLLWVGNGQQAGLISSLSQPTISRAAHHIVKSLGLHLKKVSGEWRVDGHHEALSWERQRHQLDRLQGQGSLRLEAGAISSRVLAESPPASWVLGRPDAINQPRSLDLLLERVIDAWVCTSAQDLPEEADQAFTVTEVFRTPLRLVAGANHPLVATGALRAGDLSAFPSVALDGNWYPKSAARLQHLGLWRDPQRLNHYRSQNWEGRTADGYTLAYASPVMLARDPGLVPLDFDLALEQSVALVVRKENSDHPRIQELLDALKQRVGSLELGQERGDGAAA